MGVTCLFTSTSPNTNNTNNAWRLNSNGNINNNNCTNTNGSLRQQVRDRVQNILKEEI